MGRNGSCRFPKSLLLAMITPLGPDAVAEFERCIGRGGVAVFPADTVYGLACNPGSPSSIERMLVLKGRAEKRPSAVMFFQLERMLTAIDWLGERTVSALDRLLPGPVTAVVPNPEGRYALAGGSGLGVRVPRLEGALEPLSGARVAVLQTSANPSGGNDARSVGDIVTEIIEGVDIVLDGGELSGKPSTVIDLTGYERDGSWDLLRETAVSREQLAELLDT
jgi:L-threonylcarbamoyladenylate synthase